MDDQTRLDIRDEITSVKKRLEFSDGRFMEAGKNQWENILKAIEKTFVKENPVQVSWYWEHLGEDAFCLKIAHHHRDESLGLLLPDNELVWFLVSKNRNIPRSGFWIYEGYGPEIIAMIRELELCEYYIVSKKLKWLLCENHHSWIIGTGTEIRKRMDRVRKIMGIQDMNSCQPAHHPGAAGGTARHSGEHGI